MDRCKVENLHAALTILVGTLGVGQMVTQELPAQQVLCHCP
jgi:hypothetical protein